MGSSSLRHIEIDSKDRVVKITYHKWGRDNHFYLFYKARQLYFANTYFDTKDNEFYDFKSWNNKKLKSAGLGFEIFDEVGRTSLENKEYDSSDIPTMSKLLKKEESKAELKVLEGKSKKFLKRKIKNIENDLIKVDKWPSIIKYIDEVEDISKSERKIRIDGIEIKFKEKEHYLRRDELYTKIKKLKKAKKILELRLHDTKNILLKFDKKDVVKSTLPTTKPVWTSQKPKLEVLTDKDNDFKVIKNDAMQIAIGLSSKGNDQMRKNWASKNDYWFHLDGDKSAHVILKNNNKIIDIDLLKLVASVIVTYSKLNYRTANLIYTQVKNLKSVKGSPGKVIYKKEKRIQVESDIDWRNTLSE